MYTIWFIWAIGCSIQSLLTDYVCIRKEVYQHVVNMPHWSAWRRAAHYAGRAFTVAILFVWPFFVFAFAKALLFASIPSVIFSAFYMSISQVIYLYSVTTNKPPLTRHIFISKQNDYHVSFYIFLFSHAN